MGPEALMPVTTVSALGAKELFRAVKVWIGMAPPPGCYSCWGADRNGCCDVSVPGAAMPSAAPLAAPILAIACTGGEVELWKPPIAAEDAPGASGAKPRSCHSKPICPRLAAAVI